METAHFRIRTDLDVAAARSAAVEFERFRRALLLPFGARFDPPGKLPVTLLRSLQELHEFAPETIAGFWTTSGGSPQVVLGSRSGMVGSDIIPGTVRHELAHHLLAHAFLRQPRWLAEGLAEYLETTNIKADGSVEVGRAHVRNVVQVRQHGFHSLAELWEWNGGEQGEVAMANLYASSWLWVYYLMSEHPDAFGDFLGRLAQGKDPRAAWSAAFGQTNTEALNALARQFLKTGRASVLSVPLPEVRVEPVVRTLSEAEVHVVRAELSLAGWLRSREEHLAAARADVAKALALDAGNVQASLLQLRLGGAVGTRVSDLRALTASHPQSGDAWLALGVALQQAQGTPEEVRAAYVRAVELLPEDAGAHNALAWHDVTTGRAKDALLPASRAVQLAPWSSPILDTYAAAVAALGRCPEALQVQQRAVDMLSERADAKVREPYLRRLSDYQSRCGVQASPSTP